MIFRRCTGTRTALFICKKAYGKAFFAYRMPFVLRKLKRCDDFHFDEDVLRQGLDGNAGACRLFGEILAVHLVDNAEIADIDHKHGRLDNVLSLAASRLEHREQILDALLRLLGRAAGNKCAGRRVQRKLAGDKYKTVCFDRLGPTAPGAVVVEITCFTEKSSYINVFLS